MKKSLMTLALLISSSYVFALTPSLSDKAFCDDRKDENFIKNLTMDSENLMSFRNHGGIANGGVCWWHSRFQRNALYLTIFEPFKDRLSKEETVKLIEKIRDGKEVVHIPGFDNFRDFSRVNEALIQRELEKWQKGDGTLRFAWVKGLSGKYEVDANKLKEIMDQIYEDVEVKGNISYNKLQLKGIDSHAWLVVRMEKVEGGYNLETLDSNFPNQTLILKYREGDTNVNYHGYFTFVPYLENTRELESIKEVIAKKCN